MATRAPEMDGRLGEPGAVTGYPVQEEERRRWPPVGGNPGAVVQGEAVDRGQTGTVCDVPIAAGQAVNGRAA